MIEAIDACGDGRLMIQSRGGRFVYASRGNVEKRTFDRSVGGTLIEWTLKLPTSNQVTT